MTSSDSHVAGNCFPSGLLVPFRHQRKAQPNLLFHLGRHYEWMTLIILYLDQLSTLDPICRFVEVAESSESVIIEPCQRLALAYITISVTACCTRDNGVDAKRQSTYKSRKLEEDWFSTFRHSGSLIERVIRMSAPGERQSQSAMKEANLYIVL